MPKTAKPRRKVVVKKLIPLEEQVTDKSPYIAQRDKFNGTLRIRELPWTQKQKEIISLFMDKGTKALFLKGPAGTGKTLITVYCGLQLLNKKTVSDMVLVRAAVESSDSRLGFLPGTVEDKMGVYMAPYTAKMEELLTRPDIAALENDSRVTPCPINYARGLHFAAKFVCIDEAQDMTRKELHTMISRIGEFSKVFICGDPEQCDLPYGKSGYNEVYDLFNNEESREHGIHCIELTEDDIVRSEFCKFITMKFKELNKPTLRMS